MKKVILTLAIWLSLSVSAVEFECDVIVAGGSTAALSTALTSAREGSKTCLVEPTDWPGGQLTAGGVPAVDFAWHKVDGYDVGKIGKDFSIIYFSFQI